MSITSVHRPATSEEFDYFISFCLNESLWKFTYENSQKNVRVWEQLEKTSVKTVRVHAVFEDISAWTLYDTIHDPAYRHVWDDNMITEHTTESLDPFNEVCYYSVKLIGFSNRDFVTKRSWRVKDEREFVIISRSVEHPKEPERPGFVRGNTMQTGYLIYPQGKGCTLMFVTQTDLRGYMPSFITKHIAPSIIEKLGKAAGNYEEWKARNNPHHKPWRGDQQTHAAVERKKSRWHLFNPSRK